MLPLQDHARRMALKAGAAMAWAWVAPQAKAQDLRKVTIVYPTVSQASWPFWIAKQAGYYQKYGLDVELKFGVHPAGMASVISGESLATNSGLEQVLAAGLRDPTLVMVGSSLSRGSFSLVSQGSIQTVKDLRGKRIGVGRVGDTPYFYTVELLNKYGLASTHVQWVSTGADAASRAAMLANGQLDAALLTAPAYFKLLESDRFRELTSLMQHADIPVTTVYLMKRSKLIENPKVAQGIIKANAEAIKRFYVDKAFAVATYRKYDPADQAATERLYDLVAGGKAFERIPVVRRSSLAAAARRLEAELPAIKTLDFSTIVDNSIVRQLAAEGWFVSLFGPEVAAEQAQRLKEGV
jgi:ABC-type nitrate/sulfonate/bicarbonate transport system substrate-binding protein